MIPKMCSSHRQNAESDPLASLYVVNVLWKECADLVFHSLLLKFMSQKGKCLVL
jgi:hypothetical protein